MALCKTHKLNERYIPRDVRTRWNSTYDMLAVTLKYQRVYNAFTADLENGLRAFELKKRDWKIVEQLADVLKV